MSINVWQDQGVVVAPVSSDTPGQPNVLYESGAVILSGTVFKMWFGTANGLCYAESSNGTSWTRYSSNPVISHTGQLYTRLLKVGSTYYLWSSNTTSRQIAAYTSPDGITWTLQNAAAIVPGTGGAWDSGADGVYPASAIYSSGTFYLYYSAYDSTNNSYPGGVALSSDGINFTKYNGTGGPVINDGIISCNFWFKEISGLFYGWTQITLPGLPTAAAACPSDISRYVATNPVGPWTYLGTNTVYRTQTSEGVGVSSGQIADPSLVEANGNVYLYCTVTPNGVGTTAGYQINCLIASSTSIAALVNGYEGVQNIPAPWGSASGSVNFQTLASDNFQRPNANPIGGNWTPLFTGAGFAPAQLASHLFESSVAGDNCDSYWNAITWPNDQWVTITVNALPDSSSYFGIDLRATPGPFASATVYRIFMQGPTSGGVLTIGKYVNGTFSSIQAYTLIQFAPGDTFTAAIVGNTISVYRNGNLMEVPVTDSSIASGVAGCLVAPSSGSVSNAQISAFAGGGFNFNVTGNCGIGGATVAYSGLSSGSVTANSSGDFTISSLAPGSYTLAVSKVGNVFSPLSQNVSISANTIVIFTGYPSSLSSIATLTQTATENFTPDANPLNPANWEKGAANENLQAISSTCEATANAVDDCVESWIGTTLSNDQYVQAKLARWIVGNGQDIILFVDTDVATVLTGLSLAVVDNAAGGTADIALSDFNASTTLFDSPSATVAVGDVFIVGSIGKKAFLLHNGVLLFSGAWSGGTGTVAIECDTEVGLTDCALADVAMGSVKLNPNAGGGGGFGPGGAGGTSPSSFGFRFGF